MAALRAAARTPSWNSASVPRSSGDATDHYDLIVIGSGPAGRRAAIQAAKLGNEVLVIENRLRVGGVSVHTGTIPSKTLRETVLNLSGWRERGFYGLAYRVKKDIEGKDLGARLRMTLDHEIDVLEHQFARNGVKTVAGRARFRDPHAVTVGTPEGENVYEADKFVIAVGTAPFRPAHIPFNGTSVFDSDDVASDPRVPKSLTVVGAGVIGLEYATIYSALDVPVTLVEPREQFLEFIDREIIEEFVHDLRKRGMQMRIGVKVE
ncbi:MAG: FAD-dependent oxidoreductase, partial [Devosia sp.]